MTIAAIKLGTCEAQFDGLDLGLTLGGVEVEVSSSTKEVNVDKFGETPVDEQITGRRFIVRVPMAESTVENLTKAIAGAETVVDAVDGTKKHSLIKHSTGLSLRSIAKTLRLRPHALVASGDPSEDVTLKAAPVGNVSFSYKVDEERVFTAEFHAFVDETTGELAKFGDASAVA